MVALAFPYRARRDYSQNTTDLDYSERGCRRWTTNEVGMADLVYDFNVMPGQADGHSRSFQLAVRLK